MANISSPLYYAIALGAALSAMPAWGWDEQFSSIDYSGYEWAAKKPKKDITSSITHAASRTEKEERLIDTANITLTEDSNTFQVNSYVREMPRMIGQSYQVTLAWNAPMEIGSTKLVFEGLVDYTSSEAHAETDVITQPRLLVDVGNYWGEAGHLYAGIEYDYWNNKLDLMEMIESPPQTMVKWVF